MRRLPFTPVALTASLLAATALAALLATPAPAHAAWPWPVSGEVITPYRNGTDPYATGQHRGIDIAAPVGTAVRAAAGGEVRFAGTAGSSGLTISIRTGDGYDTSYLHLSSLAVRAGAHVATGDRIGAVGTTGTRSAAAPHLHFGVRDAGTRHAYHDPLAFLPPPPTPPGRAEPPPAATAPQPSPAPPAAAPAPAPRRAPAPAPRRAPAPAAGGAPLPRGAPGPAPIQSRRGAAVGVHPPVRIGARRRTPVPAERPAAAEPGDASTVGHEASRTAASRERATPPTRPHEVTPRWSESHSAGSEGLADGGPGLASLVDNVKPEAEPGGGPDIGWILACAGLLLAAGILGLTSNDRRATRRRPTTRSTRNRTRTRLLGAVSPLPNRR